MCVVDDATGIDCCLFSWFVFVVLLFWFCVAIGWFLVCLF